MKYHIEKDGWRVELFNDQCRWVEANPTYTHKCSRCSGSGYVPDRNCHHRRDGDWMGMGCNCHTRCSCVLIHGVGVEKDLPEYPMPSIDILIKLEEELRKTMKKFGEDLNAGIVEREIEEEKKFNASMKGANL